MWGLAAFVLCFAVGLTLAAWRAPPWIWALALAAIALAAQIGLLQGHIETPTFGLLGLLCWFVVAILAALSIVPLRRAVFVAPVYRMLRRALPRVPGTVQQALEGGTTGFDAELFRGTPDWQKLRSIPPAALTAEELAFFNGPTEALCGMIDDWQIRHDRREIPEDVWGFVKANGFLGLRISKQYGGRGFSASALSLILGKIASRSPDVFGLLMIPNTLGLAELIERHGTDAQKRHYLPRLASGQDVPCLALTGPDSGSDAAAMRDIGSVVRGSHRGADTIGIRASWDKRYITLAPDATLIGVAFRLFDPENLLGKSEEVGITLAIVPADHAGVEIGRRHLPAGAAFPNGPTRGKDVFIPLDWVIGGEAMVGRGWPMIMEGLSASRVIAMPSCAAAGAKTALRVSTAYGRIRRQFGYPIGQMEGLEEPLARMIENAYVSEASRAVTVAMLSRGEKPTVIAALMKYQLTERLRRSVNDAMDVHGGRSVFDGPANYLQSMYQMVPSAIVVEGVNIVTRTVIVFALGVLKSHPYFAREFAACRSEDEGRGLAAFENAFLAHISFFLSNLSAAFFHNLTGGRFCAAPADSSGTGAWYRQLARASRSFAFVTDLTVVALGGRLRIRQKLTGRLADALSEMFLLACVLKRCEDDGMADDDRHFVAFAAQNALHRFEEAMRGTIDNFPSAWARLMMKLVVFPLGARRRPAPDRLGHRIVRLASEPGAARDRLTRDIYVSKDMRDPTGLLEVTLEKAVKADDVFRKVDQAARRGAVRRYLGNDWIGDAVSKNLITAPEGDLLREFDVLAARVVAVDDFDPDEVRPNYMTAGHNIRAVRDAAKEN
jgi:acyl-CoA dehydrogenase